MIKLCAFADEASEEFSGQITALKRNHFSMLEIRGVDGENISKLSLKKVEEIKKSLDNNGLKVWSIGSPVGKSDPCVDFDTQLDTFKRLCEGAQILGAEKIRMFSFYTKNELDAFRGLEAFLKATPKGITLCHENEKGIFGDDYESCLKIHKAFPEIKAVFDPANYVQCGVDTKKAWECISPYIVYIHIKDAVAGKNENVVCGTGDGQIAKILTKAFEEDGYRGFLTLEPHLVLFATLQSLEVVDATEVISENKAKDGAEGYEMQFLALREILRNIRLYK
jgi:sugar phosphate isomerase/epimerase